MFHPFNLSLCNLLDLTTTAIVIKYCLTKGIRTLNNRDTVHRIKSPIELNVLLKVGGTGEASHLIWWVTAKKYYYCKLKSEASESQ